MPRGILCTASCALVLAGGAATAAGGTPPLASSQDPPRFLDETELRFELLNRNKGYHFFVDASIHGPLSSSDAVRIDLMQKGKALTKLRCPLDGGEDGASFKCRYDGNPIKAVGPVTANIILIDDQAEKEYLLRQLNMTVVAFPWMQEKNYQILHDDMLGAAYVWHSITDDSSTHELDFYFWTSGSFKEDPQMRCTVDGKKQPDFEGKLASGVGGVSVDAFIKGKQVTYQWGPEVMSPDRLWWGTYDEVKKDTVMKWEPEKAKAAGYHYLADMAGVWDCKLRYQSNVVREFRFKVNDKGRIEPSAAQSAPGFPKLPPGVVHIEMRLPAKNDFDTRVRPDAIKKSMPYGLPWPKHADIDAFKKSLPAASGLKNPPRK
jgi:hypothetical protein